LRLTDSGINANEKGIVHDYIRIAQIANNPALDIFKGRMPQQIAAEKVAGLNPIGLQEPG
jgi:hypothetical protein